MGTCTLKRLHGTGLDLFCSSNTQFSLSSSPPAATAAAKVQRQHRMVNSLICSMQYLHTCAFIYACVHVCKHAIHTYVGMFICVKVCKHAYIQ